MRLDLLEWPGFDWYDPRYALPVIPVGVTCLRMVYRGLDWSSSAGAPKRPLFLLVCCVRITGSSSSSSSSKGSGASRARWVQPRARGCAQACRPALRAAGAGVQCRPASGSTLLIGKGRDECARMACKRERRTVRSQCAGARQPPGRRLRGRSVARAAWWWWWCWRAGKLAVSSAACLATRTRSSTVAESKICKSATAESKN